MQWRIYPRQDRPPAIASSAHTPPGPFLARIRPMPWPAVPEGPDPLAAAPRPRRRRTGPSALGRGVLRRSRRDGSSTTAPARMPPVACPQLTAAPGSPMGVRHGEPKEEKATGRHRCSPWTVLACGGRCWIRTNMATLNHQPRNHSGCGSPPGVRPGRRAGQLGRQAGTSTPGKCRSQCRGGLRTERGLLPVTDRWR
jgi:hypothetical protein